MTGRQKSPEGLGESVFILGMVWNGRKGCIGSCGNSDIFIGIIKKLFKKKEDISE